MSKKNKNELKKTETFEKLHDKKPVTRRDFLSAGLIGFTSSMILPPLLVTLAKSGNAEAQEMICNIATGLELCPFVNIKLSGGMAMAANFLPLDQGGLLLPSYSLMGMGLGSTVPVAYEFANRATFYGNSSLLAGIRLNATAATLAKSNFVGVCVRSQDDSSANKFDITGLVGKAGLSGKILPNLGRSNTATGVSNDFAHVRPNAPLVVSNFSDIEGALNITGSLSTFSKVQKSNLFRSIQNLNNRQVAAVSQMTGGNLLSRLLGCANQDNTKLISATTAELDINPLSNTAFSQIWQIDANTPKNSMNFIFASMVYNAINGNASTINLEIGGFDYHNGTRATGDNKDLQAGQVIGQVLQSFALMNKKTFITVTSDGAVGSAQSDVAGSPWMGDRGIAGAGYMMSYDPLGAHAIKSGQVGHYTAGQGSDDKFLTGANVELAAAAMFANYMAFNGKLSSVETILPRIFSTEQLDLVTKFT
jgi:hypothetical protein